MYKPETVLEKEYPWKFLIFFRFKQIILFKPEDQT